MLKGDQNETTREGQTGIVGRQPPQISLAWHHFTGPGLAICGLGAVTRRPRVRGAEPCTRRGWVRRSSLQWHCKYLVSSTVFDASDTKLSLPKTGQAPFDRALGAPEPSMLLLPCLRPQAAALHIMIRKPAARHFCAQILPKGKKEIIGVQLLV